MFVYGASYADDFAHAQSYGWAVGTPGFDWPTLRDNKDREIARINGVYGKLLADAGARLIRGPARLRDEPTIEINGKRHHAATILIATGSAPHQPAIPGGERRRRSHVPFNHPPQT